MPAIAASAGWSLHRRLLSSALFWLGVALLTVFPDPLAPIARLYHALCAPFPALAVLGRLLPPRPLALLLLLGGIVLAVAVVTGMRELIRMIRIQRHITAQGSPLPPRLEMTARDLRLEGRLAYTATPTPAAFCIGLLVPRIALTAGLLARLDDAELAAVLLHERHHLHRRDPLRYLVLHALSAGLFMVPLALELRRWAETQCD
jgi:Zn-dependent protease with chaperone function